LHTPLAGRYYYFYLVLKLNWNWANRNCYCDLRWYSKEWLYCLGMRPWMVWRVWSCQDVKYCVIFILLMVISACSHTRLTSIFDETHCDCNAGQEFSEREAKFNGTFVFSNIFLSHLRTLWYNHLLESSWDDSTVNFI